jgi:hypothetical protein
MTWRFIGSCVLALLLVPIAHAEAPAAGKATEVPFDLLKTKHMVIQVKVNGKGPYRVIFDTGAPVMLLNTKVGRESGLLGKNTRAPLFSLFGNMGQTKIHTLEIGGLKVENVPCMVMDHPTVEVISKFLGPVEGIVGFPFFARYQMTLDYQAKKLTFVPNGYEPPDALESLTKSVMTLMEDNPKPKILSPAAQWGLVLQKEKDDQEAGVGIREVLPGSAAATAGLKAGDRLLTLDSRWTDSVADAYLAAGHVKPGTTAQVVVQRNGKEVALTVKPRAGL